MIDAKAPLAYQTYPEIAKSICDALQKEAVEPDEELAGQQLSVLFEKNKFLDNVTLLC